MNKKFDIKKSLEEIDKETDAFWKKHGYTSAFFKEANKGLHLRHKGKRARKIKRKHRFVKIENKSYREHIERHIKREERNSSQKGKSAAQVLSENLDDVIRKILNSSDKRILKLSKRGRPTIYREIDFVLFDEHSVIIGEVKISLKGKYKYLKANKQLNKSILLLQDYPATVFPCAILLAEGIGNPPEFLTNERVRIMEKVELELIQFFKYAVEKYNVDENILKNALLEIREETKSTTHTLNG